VYRINQICLGASGFLIPQNFDCSYHSLLNIILCLKEVLTAELTLTAVEILEGK
jgi:hypothetical protein